MEPTESLRRCFKCELLLPRSEFRKNVARKDGLRSRCRHCDCGYGQPRRCRRCGQKEKVCHFYRNGRICKPCHLKSGQRYCTKCKRLLPTKEFLRKINNLGELDSSCRKCKSAVRRDHAMKTLFGLSRDDYDRMLTIQKGKCAICGKRGTRHRHLSVDHNHVDGQVRGLLCQNCNGGLGMFQDSPSVLIAAISYLKQHRAT